MPRQLVAELAAQYSNVIKTNKYSGAGVSCEFYFIGSNLGLKVYKNRRVRDNNFFVQNLLHHYGYAPKAVKRINIDKKQFAFTTELCEVAKNIIEEQWRIWAYGPYTAFGKWGYWDNLWKQFHTMKNRLTKGIIGDIFDIRDLHDANFGVNYKTNEMNVIDVGHFRIKGLIGEYGSHMRVEECDTKTLVDIIYHGCGINVRKL